MGGCRPEGSRRRPASVASVVGAYTTIPVGLTRRTRSMERTSSAFRTSHWVEEPLLIAIRMPLRVESKEAKSRKSSPKSPNQKVYERRREEFKANES